MPPGLAAPLKKEMAARLVASAENSTLDWRSLYGAIEYSGNGDGYIAGIIGFCSGTNDMLQLVEQYTKEHPGNPLASYLPDLRAVDGTDSQEGSAPASRPPGRRPPRTRRSARPRTDPGPDLFDPAVRLAKLDGLSTLGQFIYYDAMVLHGPGLGPEGFYGIREAAMRKADNGGGGRRREGVSHRLPRHKQSGHQDQALRQETSALVTHRHPPLSGSFCATAT